MDLLIQSHSLQHYFPPDTQNVNIKSLYYRRWFHYCWTWWKPIISYSLPIYFIILAPLYVRMPAGNLHEANKHRGELTWQNGVFLNRNTPTSLRHRLLLSHGFGMKGLALNVILWDKILITSGSPDCCPTLGSVGRWPSVEDTAADWGVPHVPITQLQCLDRQEDYFSNHALL